MAGAPENQHPDALIVQPVREVAGEVAAHIRRLRPSVVLTFDPIGGYRHPDHIHIHEATRMAFERAADPAFFPEAGPPFGPGRLYYHTIPHGFLKFGVLLLRILGRDPRRFGQNGDIDLAAIAEVNFPIHARIPIASVRTRKEQAAACHSSQGGGRMGGGLLTRLTRLLDRYETYMRAYPVPASGQRAESDLFA
jgi:LmbE family N-acetylglucosaminyl deacetylase